MSSPGKDAESSEASRADTGPHDAPPSPRPRNAVRNPTPAQGDIARRVSLPGADLHHETANTGKSGASNKFLPRSLTVAESNGHGGFSRTARNAASHAFANNASRAASFHAGAGQQTADQRTSANEAAYTAQGDLERQSNGTGNGSDVVLQGRSYRFHPASSDIHHMPLVSPYTATSNTIRDSTAMLADMALRSEDGESEFSFEREGIEERSDEDGSPEVLQDAAADVDPIPISAAQNSAQLSTTSQSLTPASQRSKGPSNLSRVLEEANSRATSTAPSPSSSKTAKHDEQSYFVEEEAQENTPLIDKRSRDVHRVRKDDARSGQRRSSHSRSKSPIDPGQSGFSVFSNQSGTGAGGGSKHNNSSTYGYGALAQASQFGRPHVSFAESNQYDDDESDRAFEEPSTGWSLLPHFLRRHSQQTPFSLSDSLHQLAIQAKKLTWRDVASAGAEPIRLLPAVVLGLLLNVLDGVSYGLIIFPTSYPIFSDFGGDGVSMFFVTCVISQLVYTLGGSIFKGGNGSMMIEVVPFYHILVTIIIDTLGDQDPAAVVSTTMVAFALSSIFAGIVFLVLGFFRLGVLIGFFPRHILVGCIGGVGVFLIETGLEVAGQLKSEEGFQWNLDTFRYFTQSWDMVAHWLPPLALAILLRLITAKFHQPLVFPAYFLLIPVFFYIITVGFAGISLDTLRKNAWIFDVGKAAEAPFWRFYTYFDFRKTSWEALWATMPTQLALTFFSILHVPLNVPALAVSVNEDNLDTDRELLAHGVSNIIAGLAGSVPNYLCYVNSVLFYRVGGGNRLSGLMLAGGTFILFLCGPGAIGYLPIMVVGALIFVLGIDLTKEAVWDTIGRVNAWEYFTIWLIIFVMTYYDFVVGILSGIIVACLFFVIQTSRRRTVRAVLDGSIARSTVRRHTTQRQFLAQAGRQTQIVKLQGFLYFANISSVEELIRRALDIAAWQANPIRFLIIDFSLVYGVDFSAAEALTRIQRLLQAKDVVFVFCGLTPDSDVGIALRSVDLWTDSTVRLEIFQNLNEALEWTENEYLRNMYHSTGLSSTKPALLQHGQRAALNVPESKRAPAFNLGETSENSPRRQHLFEAALEAVHGSSKLAHNQARGDSDDHADVRSPKKATSTDRRRLSHTAQARPGVVSQPAPQPHSLLTITFQAWARAEHDDAFFRALTPYFVEHRLLKGEVLWQRGDPSDGLYLIESGILKARYDFPQEDYEINEAMLAGTIAGELSFLSNANRNTTAFAEIDCTLWKLDRQSLTQLRNDHNDIFDHFLQLLLSACTEEQEGLMSYLVSRLS